MRRVKRTSTEIRCTIPAGELLDLLCQKYPELRLAGVDSFTTQTSMGSAKIKEISISYTKLEDAVEDEL